MTPCYISRIVIVLEEGTNFSTKEYLGPCLITFMPGLPRKVEAKMGRFPSQLSTGFQGSCCIFITICLVGCLSSVFSLPSWLSTSAVPSV